MYVGIHADDYGYSINTSKDMLECMKKGCLNSFSIICNTSNFEESMELLYLEIPNLPFLPFISVHINLPEGNGEYLPKSWAQLFLVSYSLKRKRIKEEIKEEIRKQIDTVNEVVTKCIAIAKNSGVECKQKGLRIDSHVHTHHIPVVWDALMEVIEEENYDVEYIRNSKEPITPFIKHIDLISTYGITNIIKNRILMLYSKKIDDYCDKKGIEKMYMWGLMMSGHMDFDRIKEVYKDMYDYANKHNRNLELLFHPGQANENEYSNEKNKDYFTDFNSSNNRLIEKDSVLRIKEIIG